MSEKQGGLANQSGNTLEQTIVGVLGSKGFTTVPFKDYKKAPEKYSTEILLKGVPFKSIYGHSGKTEFLLKSQRYQLEIRIECKWQQVCGSVDEKLVYAYINCVEAMPEKTIIIVVDGGGAKAGAIDWLKRTAKEKRYLPSDQMDKEILVFTLAEFLCWANKTFR